MIYSTKMPFFTERFKANLIVCRGCIISFSSCSKSEDAMQNLYGTETYFLSAIFTEIINVLPRYVGEGVSDKVICYWQLLIYFNTPSSMR